VSRSPTTGEEEPELLEIEVDEEEDILAAGFDPAERLAEARVFAKYGLVDKATAHLEEILQHFPDHVEARQALVDQYVDRSEHAAAARVAAPLYEAYRKAGDESSLAALMALLPPRAEAARSIAEPEDLEEEVIILDLDAAGEDLGMGPEAVESSGADLVFDLDAVQDQPPSAATEQAAAEPPVDSPLAKALEQLDSFIDSDLHEDAIRLLGRLESEYGDDEEVAERRLALKAKGVLLEEVVSVPTGGSEELFADEEESFVDLAKELEAELAEEEAMVEEATGKGKEEAILEEVFREFQRGVQEQLSEEDSDTHFNLGIAYKEMGLLPESIREFQVASRNPQFFVEACSMIGMCYMEQGMWSQAAEWYQKALTAPDLSEETRLALRYDLAASLESAGEVERAVDLYQEVVAQSPDYRDVSTRLDSLSNGR
jgi:tetratricopeptide (TPR) repeat protein